MIQPPILKTDSPETTAQKPVEPAAQPAAPPIHPLSAGLLVAVDNLWNLADWAVENTASPQLSQLLTMENSVDTLRVRSTVPIPQADMQFFRLRVTLP